MLHHYLPLFCSRVATYCRQAFELCHQLVRMTPIGFVRPSLWSAAAFGSDLDKIREIERPGSPRARSPLLIHYHIFKNAGTSFKASLIEALGKEAVAAYDSSSPGGFVSARELARFAYQHPEVKVI